MNKPEAVDQPMAAASKGVPPDSASGVSSPIKTTRTILQILALLLAGVTIGAGATIFFVSAGPAVYERGMILGIGAGLALFAAFVLFRVVLGVFLNRSVGEAGKYASGFISTLRPVLTILRAGKPLLPEEETAVQQLAQRAGTTMQSGAQLLMSYAGAVTSIALAAGVVGAVVSMAAVVAANHQVQRMDDQNELIKSQIFEATATRVSQVFAAQLPSLLEAIEESRSRSSAIPDDVWIAEPELIARIQALIYATQPYSRDEEVDLARDVSTASAVTEDSATSISGRTTDTESSLTRYSPERGQLLSILVAAKFPFDTLTEPLDFSNADLRGMALGRRSAVVGPTQAFSLGLTILRDSNLRNSRLAGLDLSRVDLSRAVLPRLSEMFAVTFWSPNELPPDPRRREWVLHRPILEKTLFENSGSGSEIPWDHLNNHLNSIQWNVAPVGQFIQLSEKAAYTALARAITDFMDEVNRIDREACKVNDLRTWKTIQSLLTRVKSSDEKDRTLEWIVFATRDYEASTTRCALQSLQKGLGLE
jgi:hypothetical protein